MSKPVTPYERLRQRALGCVFKFVYPKTRNLTSVDANDYLWVAIKERIRAADQLGHDVVASVDGEKVVFKYRERVAIHDIPWEFRP